MNRRRFAALLVVPAIAVVVVGLLARPLLVRAIPARTSPAPPSPSIAAAAPAAVLDIARRGATTSMCTGSGRSCPAVTVDRIQGYCPTPDRCLVALLTSHAAAGASVPVALTVTVVRDATGWHVAQVRS